MSIVFVVSGDSEKGGGHFEWCRTLDQGQAAFEEEKKSVAAYKKHGWVAYLVACDVADGLTDDEITADIESRLPELQLMARRWPAREEKHEVWVLWGGASTVREVGRDSLSQYAFDTAAELAAFNLALSEADGWCENETFDTAEEADERLGEILSDHPEEQADAGT